MIDQSTSLYTVRKVKEDDTLYGPSHGSVDGYTTIYGEELSENWFITNNTFDGVITCKKCLERFRDTIYHEL